MVSEVARIVGDETDSNIRSQALDCLNRARISLNRREWRFKKVTAAAITLVDGTKTYTLPSAFNRPSFARLLDTSSKPYADLRYVDDAWLAHQLPQQDASGQPVYYQLRNHFADGLVTLYPTPDVGAAAAWTLSVEYYGRIASIADDATPISEPEELCDVLVLGGQYQILKERNHADRLAPARADFYQALSDLITWDRRVSDEQARFTLRPTRLYPFGTIVIRV
jgi:hypothetical protein